MSERKLRIGVDIDDVLLKSAELSVEMYNEAYDTSITMETWYDFSDLKAWGNDDFSELVRRVVDLMSDDAFLNVEPLEGASEVLSHLKNEGHDLFAITGRSESIRKQTRFVLDRCYPAIFRDETTFFVDHFEHDGKKMSKADVGLELGLTHFIEDFPVHATAMAKVGVKTILFSPGYKWNKDGVDEDVKDDVVVLGAWQSIGEFLDAEAAR